MDLAADQADQPVLVSALGPHRTENVNSLVTVQGLSDGIADGGRIRNLAGVSIIICPAGL